MQASLITARIRKKGEKGRKHGILYVTYMQSFICVESYSIVLTHSLPPRKTKQNKHVSKTLWLNDSGFWITDILIHAQENLIDPSIPLSLTMTWIWVGWTHGRMGQLKYRGPVYVLSSLCCTIMLPIWRVIKNLQGIPMS